MALISGLPRQDAIDIKFFEPWLRNESETILYSVVDTCGASHVKSFIETLESDSTSLFYGKAKREFQDIAPYLIRLDKQSLQWIQENVWDEPWGFVFGSQLEFESLRRHFRRFLLVEGPNGKELFFRFYDPRILRSFLKAASKEVVAQFLEPIRFLYVVTEDLEVEQLYSVVDQTKATDTAIVSRPRFSESDFSAMAEASQKRFRTRLIEHLAQEHEKCGKKVDAELLSAQVNEGVSRAMRYEIWSQQWIARYVEILVLEFGGFQEAKDPLPIRNIMLDRRHAIQKRLVNLWQLAKHSQRTVES